MRVISYVGGWQSNALLVLAAQGQIDYKTFLFANVGEDSESAKTLSYIKQWAIPYAQQHGIALIELRKLRRDGTISTIYQNLKRPGSRSIGIPVRMNGNGAPGRRSCTYDFKIAVIDKWLRKHRQGEAVQVGIGFSLDEIERVKPNTDPDTIAWKENVFPLLTEVPRPLTRMDCGNIIVGAGLPLPPKSACVFCPLHKLVYWQEMRTYEPDTFWYVADLEAFINRRRARLGLDPVWFSRALKPLPQATTEYKQALLFDEVDQSCESGYCFV